MQIQVEESADKGNLQVTLVQTHIMIHIALLVPTLFSSEV
jgi:hypothetical protein